MTPNCPSPTGPLGRRGVRWAPPGPGRGGGVTPAPTATHWFKGTLSWFGVPRSLGPPGQDGGRVDSWGSSLKCCCGCQAEFHGGKSVTRAGPGPARRVPQVPVSLPLSLHPPPPPLAPPCEPTVVQPRVIPSLMAEREGSPRGSPVAALPSLPHMHPRELGAERPGQSSVSGL